MEEGRRELELVVDFLSKKDESITLIVIGGMALDLYGLSRGTRDIDAEIDCSEDTYLELLSFTESQGILINIGEDISRWGLIPLPQGYRERAIKVMTKKGVTVKVLEPLDYVFSKLIRGTDIDERDAEAVCSACNITPEMIEERLRLIALPRDIESRFFLDRTRRFIKRLKERRVTSCQREET